MCGRYSLTLNLIKLLERYGIKTADIEFDPSREIFPTDRAPIVIKNSETGSKQLRLLRWGFSPSFTRRPVINARGETLTEKSLFKQTFSHQRCLIPATSFYEWKDMGETKKKYEISVKNTEVFSLAGLYDTFKIEGREICCYTIITTRPSPVLSEIHDRMPLILKRDCEHIWLDNSFQDTDALKQLIKPLDNELLLLNSINT